MEVLLVIAVLCGAAYLISKLLGSPPAETHEPDPPPPSDYTRKWLSKDEADTEMVVNEDGEPNFTLELRDELRFASKTSGLQVAPGNLALARTGIFYFHTRGGQYYPFAQDNSGIRVGALVNLNREPDNPYGKTAIALSGPKEAGTWGYVNKGFSVRLSKTLDAGEPYVAVITGERRPTVAAIPLELWRKLKP